ncbi:response regulator transcription factor [Crassaminicella thermophila]|uniref:Stage 0 sporulation protein A homolog n=1 Tax=Crassaminicella thermophila TaxID=2599308 RepID=A0A5C0SGT1_CRATE|nr:response regulator transcription factor [Crassaminicella thermophila]QEK12857.1 response regulator transcription factor [Crassaminicella thermophila]
MKHIFVVDDEANIRELIKKYLQKEGYKVTLFNNGENVLSELGRLKPDLLVLDIMMPGIDGLEICREIRKKSEIPIIFVSARDEEFDRILGLELGADDYLSKPFSPRELVVRIKTILRRIEKGNNIQNESIALKDMKMYCNRRYIEVNGDELKLTTKEYELFEMLVKNKNIPFTREQLLEKIWGYDYIGDTRVIDDLVKRIRKKLKQLESELEIITVWGYGYRIDG